MAVAAQLAIAALPIGFEHFGGHRHGLMAVLGSLQHQPQKVDQHDAIALRRPLREYCLVADRDAVLIGADLAAIEPERLVDQRLIGLPRLRDDAMRHAKLRAFRPAAAGDLDEVLRLVDLGVGVLGEQHAAVLGDGAERYEGIAHEASP